MHLGERRQRPDVDGDQHIAVTLDDDPASDMLEWQGRFLYFHPDEIQVLQCQVERCQVER